MQPRRTKQERVMNVYLEFGENVVVASCGLACNNGGVMLHFIMTGVWISTSSSIALCDVSNRKHFGKSTTDSQRMLGEEIGRVMSSGLVDN